MPEILCPPPADSLTGQTGLVGCLLGQIFSPKPTSTEDPGLEELVRPLNAEQSEEIEAAFQKLVKEWKDSRTATSFSNTIVMHPSYQRIIGLGKKALPLILRELDRELDHWFWALKAISGEDPVPSEDRGKVKEMARAWLEWGRRKGYAR